MNISRRAILTALAGSTALALALPVQAQSVESFYKGRDVRIVLPAGMGGSFGLYGQLAAKHLGKHIPGKPNIIVQSMPGAGGLKGLTYVYNAAPKDGSVLMLPHSSVLFETLLNPDAKFDAGKFQYLGRMASTDLVGMVNKRTGVKNFEDAKAKRVVFGATGPANSTALTAMMFKRLAGGDVKVVTGYKGLARVFQAIDQGELDAICATITNPTYLDFKKKYIAGEETDFVPIFTTSPERLSFFPDAPSLFEFKDGDEKDRLFFAIMRSDGLVGRSLAFPPGVPEAYVEAFRRGFDAMVKDPAFLKETEGRGIPLDILTGEEHARQITEVIDNTPPAKKAEIGAHYKGILAEIEQ